MRTADKKKIIQKANLIREAEHIATHGFVPSNNAIEEAKPKEEDPEFSREKQHSQWQRQNELIKHFEDEYSSIIRQNPIEIFTVIDDTRKPELTNKFDKIGDIRINDNGISFAFINSEYEHNRDTYISIGPNGIKTGGYIGKDYYKISNDSLQLILTIASKLLKRSSLGEEQKAIAFNNLVNAFKNRIIKNSTKLGPE